MKKSAIGIAVAFFMMVAGSAAYAQSGGGRGDNRSGWQQDGHGGHAGWGQASRNDQWSRQDGRWGRQQAAAGERTGHVRRVRPAPNPAPAPPPTLVRPPVAARASASHNRLGRHQPMTPAQLAAVRAEMRLHAQRLALLAQVRVVARRAGNAGAVRLVNTLIARESFRHALRMAQLRPTNSRLAHR